MKLTFSFRLVMVNGSLLFYTLSAVSKFIILRALKITFGMVIALQKNRCFHNEKGRSDDEKWLL